MEHNLYLTITSYWFLA